MVKRILIQSLLAGGALAGLFLSIRGSSSPAPPRAVEEAKRMKLPVDPPLIQANNHFGFQLFEALLKRDYGDNVFISPASVALALQMTYNGAEGATQAAMTQALDLGSLTPETLNHANAALLAHLGSLDPKVQLDIANSLWYDPKHPVQPEFAQINRDYYGAEIGSLAGAPGTVNAWVKRKTQGRIPTILQPDDMVNVVAILVNAVYFKGQWTQPFDKAATKKEPFTTLQGKPKSCSMMHQSGNYSHLRGEGFQAVRLPYGNRRLSMVILLPNKGTDFRAFLAKLTPENWTRWSDGFRSQEGRIGLPRLTSNYSADLKEPLSELGMGIAFDPQHADFRRMFAGGGVWISKVRHKTFLEINEQGTEAAAATGAAIAMRAVRVPVPPFEMIMDHPFVCAIQDNQTGALLFLGSIVDPTRA